jgi:hypothetical protein
VTTDTLSESLTTISSQQYSSTHLLRLIRRSTEAIFSCCGEGKKRGKGGEKRGKEEREKGRREEEEERRMED